MSNSTVRFQAPDVLPEDRAEMVLELVLLEGKTVISRNTYDIVCGNDKFTHVETPEIKVLETNNSVSTYLTSIGAKCTSVSSIDWASLPADTPVIIGPGVERSALVSQEAFAQFVKNGGHVLMIEPGKQYVGKPASDSRLGAIPGLQADQLKIVAVDGDFVDVHEPALLDGLDPMDMHWLNALPGDSVRVCRTSYQMLDTAGLTKLATHIAPHGYISDQELPARFSWPVFEVRSGSGSVMVSSIILADDPIAQRFYGNTVRYLLGSRQ